MKSFKKVTLDGNTAAAHVAYALSQVAAIYPITPSSTMGELADAWAAEGRKNIWNETVDVVELQSEAGAAGAVHGSLSAGALTTTFTASQGLMLMLPNMHKIAGEMLPAVFHVTARSLACQSLSIFGDHSDVMSARNTGWGMLASATVQEVIDMALVSHLATLKAKVPMLHFFDGFRTSHEVSKIDEIDYATMAELSEPELITEFRNRALNPERPHVKVGQQNPDVYFQGRETVNNYYEALPGIIQSYMDKVAAVTGRQYHLFDYHGAADAESIIVVMGSATDTVTETIDHLNAKGAKLGLVKVRLFRPFSMEALKKVIPASVKKIAVLDRTKEPGALGEPLFMDVVTALRDMPGLKIIGGRYGLSSKEFTPTMVKAVFDHLANDGFHGFTVGIVDDVSHKSLPLGEELVVSPAGTVACKFWGLGSDGTVGANKNSIKIIGDNTDMYVQGYFQYDSKKSGGTTRSHLRFGKTPILSSYLVRQPDFVACHQQAFIGRFDILEGIREGGTFLLNSNWSNEECFCKLTQDMQNTIINKKIKFYNINALEIAEAVGLGGRINSVMQTAFFLISGVLEREVALKMIKKAIEKTYIRKGKSVVEQNWLAVDKTNEALSEIKVPGSDPHCATPHKKLVPDGSDEFVAGVIEPIMREKGDQITVAQMPLDGSVPSGTAKLEKRGVAPHVPHWIAESCIQCNQCSFVCPHAAIRAKLMDRSLLADKPATFNTLKAQGADGEKFDYKVQVYIDDCQGCGVCANICPKKALEMKPIEDERAIGEQDNYEFFEKLPYDVLSGVVGADSVKGSQFKQPLLEFSGACAGCGETAYVKLLTQLFGERMIMANATGCSSIWGGTFPTIPYTKNKDGRGPAWANSLFEDNAEYGFGMRLAVDANRKQLLTAVEKVLMDTSSNEFNAKAAEAEKEGGEKARMFAGIVKFSNHLKYAHEHWNDKDQAAIDNADQIKALLPAFVSICSIPERKCTLETIYALSDYFVDKSVWCLGGDGWAYDIGYGGLDHVMASGRNVNILVLDTEVYSNTGGQSSKSTPLGAVARFAEAGKNTTKKDLGLMLMSYGYIYVASVSMGANKNQLVQAMKEAEAYNGPSIILAYAPCINHGIEMVNSQYEEKLAVDTGYWLLYRFNPTLKQDGKNPLLLESKEPTKPVSEFINGEKRYTTLRAVFPERAADFAEKTDKWVKDRWDRYKKMSE